MSTTLPNDVVLGDTPGTRAPLVLGKPTFVTLTEDVAAVNERKTRTRWILTFAAAVSVLMIMAGSLVKLVYSGVGVWGLDNTVFWAWDITGFVFWIGIGHAGTLISAILYLFRQKWRTGINRAAEAMTIFAVMAAGIYPAFHVGRVWFLYWVFPVPNQMSIWPNFKSPLLWDVFAVSTYATVSILFWYVGLVPDLATLRDRAKSKIAHTAYGIFALGWRGSHRNWLTYEKAYLIFAGISTPLVLSVHTVVSFDFATSVVPGWHTTIFPPYFVAGAIFSGFAMVITLMVIARKVLDLEHIITMRHLENMCKVILATGSIVGYAYGMEFFIAWYGANEYERYVFFNNRAFGPYAWAYWTMISCNVIFPQLFWSKKVRTSIPAMFILSILVNIGMWFERFVIIVTSLHRDYIPSAWTYFFPTVWDISLFFGTFGLFTTMFLLFCRFLPVIALAEVKAILPAADPHPVHEGHEDHGHAAHEVEVSAGSSSGPAQTSPEADVAAASTDDEAPPLKPKKKKKKRRRAMADSTQQGGLVSTLLGEGGPAPGETFGVMGMFETPADLFHACEKLRDKGYVHFDAQTPFPVHGLEKAMGLKPTKIPFLSLMGGATGLSSGIALTYYCNWDYPLNVAGKPAFSWQIYIPIYFELTILTALTTFVALWAMCGLPRFFHPTMTHKSFHRTTTDGFFVVVESKDPKFNLSKTSDLLTALGAKDVEEVLA